MTDRLYIEMHPSDLASFSQEVYRLTRPTSLGDVGYVTTTYFEQLTKNASEGVVAFDKDGEQIPIHTSADTTILATIFDSFVSDGYCSGTDKTNALSAINSAKGTTVSIQTIFPATMWTARMTESAYTTWLAEP